MPLLEGLDGVEKMSKSKGNYVGITEPGNTMFAKIMSISDQMMWRYYELLSSCSLEDLAAHKKAVDEGQNPRDLKVAFAQEMVTRFHNRQAADDALADFMNRSKGGIPDDIAECKLSGAPIGISQILKQANLCPSTSDAMRMVEQGGVRINGNVIRDKGLQVAAGEFVVQVGKRKFAKIILT
jgi:tyrosyl-tRNA synthetase